jgi:exosortase/archaeosortase family protein
MNVFYVLAFLPLLLVTYSYAKWLFSAFVPFIGFLLLLIKKGDISYYNEANKFQRVLGLLVTISSFFVYYALIPYFSSPAFYGATNYAVYIFGLFLVFFEISALKEAFAPLFIIIAGISSSLVSVWLEHYFSWYIPYFISLIVAILRMLGIRVTTSVQDIISIQTLKGPLALQFIWGCVGVSSMLIFFIIMVVMVFEEHCSFKTIFLWALVGLIGTFIVNIIRVITIMLTDYHYGYEVGAQVHYFIGYVLFTLWLIIFLFAFSKRHVLAEKILLIRRKLSIIVVH